MSKTDRGLAIADLKKLIHGYLLSHPIIQGRTIVCRLTEGLHLAGIDSTQALLGLEQLQTDGVVSLIKGADSLVVRIELVQSGQ